jgi:hypothetical protein
VLRFALFAGDPLLGELDLDPDEHGCAPGALVRCRRPWHRDAPVLRRKFAHVRQLHPSVWVAEDLSIRIASAAEAMTMHDPIEMPGDDGAMRRWRRCSYDVWQTLRAKHAGTPQVERLRQALADLHGLGSLERLNAQAKAAA